MALIVWMNNSDPWTGLGLWGKMMTPCKLAREFVYFDRVTPCKRNWEETKYTTEQVRRETTRRSASRKDPRWWLIPPYVCSKYLGIELRGVLA